VLRFRLMVKRGPWPRPQASEGEADITTGAHRARAGVPGRIDTAEIGGPGPAPAGVVRSCTPEAVSGSNRVGY